MVREGKYLYGAAVQDIQDFIFQTNNLRDIVGASELVEEVCSNMFEGFIGKSDEPIQKAAGKIKCIFSDRANCEKAVLEFPRVVQSKAPGIMISQAVVAYHDGDDFANAIEELENRLMIQRNCPKRSLTLGLMGILRSRTTGFPAITIKNTKNGTEYLDAVTNAKLYEAEKRKKSTSSLCTKCFGNFNYSQIAYNIEQMTDTNDWIAVIHADGNGLGQVVQKVKKDKDNFKNFSQKLNEATVAASIRTFEHIVSKDSNQDKLILRPVLLGGDDLTIICRGNIAIDYASHFLQYFEEETEKHLSRLLPNCHNHLTACAGIAFTKSSYPFYYGYQLAEELCREAKNDAFKNADTGLAPSCLMFHKVQDSFVDSFSDIEQRELSPCDSISWKFGPYYINEEIAKRHDRWTVKYLMDVVENQFEGKDGNAIKSHLRQWMSMMHDYPELAQQEKDRIIDWAQPKQSQFVKDIALNPHYRTETTVYAYPVYDLLSLHSIIYKSTKTKD